jgi:RimJ/RimL family protein N-acetyltransferase
MLAGQAAEWSAVGFCLWWWRERSSGELIGMAGLHRDRVEDEPVVEVGWSVAPARWGEGLASEAAASSLAWGFEVAGLDEIVSFTLHDNVASRRVMEKTGLAYSRDFLRRDLPHMLYRVRREEWAARGGR